MGYSYTYAEDPRPFVPATIVFCKKKAKELRQLVPDAKLSECQQAIAKSLHWNSWFDLEQAIKSGGKPSDPDELVGDVETNNRWVFQIGAMQRALRVRPTDAEYLVAKLGLTCSPETATQRQSDHGPWGSFVAQPKQIAPGILFGQCAKFHCYRLSEELVAQMPVELRLDTGGWYMCDDHAWRVELSFPSLFPEHDLIQAREQAEQEPFIYEMLHGCLPLSAQVSYSLSACRKMAIEAPESWFAISCFPDWMFGDKLPKANSESLLAVSALQGGDLVKLIDAKGGWDAPDWSSANVRWFVIKTKDLLASDGRVNISAYHPAIRLTGLQATEIEPVAKDPVKQQAFSIAELEFGSSLNFAATANDDLVWSPNLVIV